MSFNIDSVYCLCFIIMEFIELNEILLEKLY